MDLEGKCETACPLFNMKKVMLMFGTRPEAIKMCPLVNELKKRPEFKTVVCVTGQHREMLDEVLKVFSVEPDYDFSIMENTQTLFSITQKILKKTEETIKLENPDIVLVHGDTTSAFSAALACFYTQTPIGHVEAGLRTYNVFSPYPEEFNRRAIDIVSSLCFAPTETAKQNLINEGVATDSIHVTGNTAIDALKTTVKDNYSHPLLQTNNDKRLILLTAHRRENWGEPMTNMFKAIRKIVEENNDVFVVYPTHLNPIVRNIAKKELSDCDRIFLIPPLGVIDFHNFIAKSYMILTDSGGIQEEAPALGKPVLVMRDTTERPEGIEAGTLKLTGTSETSIYTNFKTLLKNKEEYKKMSLASNPYGDGFASKRIADILAKHI